MDSYLDESVESEQLEKLNSYCNEIFISLNEEIVHLFSPDFEYGPSDRAVCVCNMKCSQ